MVPVPAGTDDQMLAALRVTQEGASVAVTQASLHQLQSSPNITLSGEIAGQQIFLVTDPQQIEALQVIRYIILSLVALMSRLVLRQKIVI